MHRIKTTKSNGKGCGPMLDNPVGTNQSEIGIEAQRPESRVDAYFSADVETDGPIPGPFSILSFALVYAGSFDGKSFQRPQRYEKTFYKELQPISDNFQEEALQINGLDRVRLCREGESPERAMKEAYWWVKDL